MRFERKPNWPSIFVELDSGLEFTDHADRDVRPPLACWGCD